MALVTPENALASTVRGRAHLDAVRDTDADQRRRAERANIRRPLPLHAQLELDSTRRHDVRAGADVRAVGVDRGFLCGERESQQRTGVVIAGRHKFD